MIALFCGMIALFSLLILLTSYKSILLVDQFEILVLDPLLSLIYPYRERKYKTVDQMVTVKIERAYFICKRELLVVVVVMASSLTRVNHQIQDMEVYHLGNRT